MLFRNRVISIATAFLFVVGMLTGCSDDNSVGPPVDDGPPPPVFNVSSIGTTLDTGDPGILFRASPNVRIRMVEVVVTNPNNDRILYSPQGIIVRANESFDLQNPGTAFFRWSGNWSFQFVGNHEPTGESFDVNSTMNVSAKELSEYFN